MLHSPASNNRRDRLETWRKISRRGRLARSTFEHLVVEAIAGLPPRFATKLDNVVVVVEDHPPAPAEGGEGSGALLGLFEGNPLGDRGGGYHLATPDRITIYRLPILDICETREEVVEEIRDTVIHEVGHFFGLGDDELT